MLVTSEQHYQLIILMRASIEPRTIAEFEENVHKIHPKLQRRSPA